MMDALDRLLELARAEGAGSAEGAAAFAGGLRERARLVLEERVGPLQERIRALEREAAWRRESMPLALALVWLPLPYILSHAGVLSGPRLPLDGVLLCYAAFALAGFLPRYGRALRRGPHQPLPE